LERELKKLPLVFESLLAIEIVPKLHHPLPEIRPIKKKLLMRRLGLSI
jgi:hypothetical protein